MSNLIFSLNATLPIFLVMMAGYALNKIGIIDDGFASRMNTFVFKLALPFSLFSQLYKADFSSVWDTGYVAFCFFATLLSIFLSWIIARAFREKNIRGEIVQASYRSSASLLGMAYIENIYGKAAMGPLMIIGCVPLYNVAAVVILSFMSPESSGLDKERIKKSLIGVAMNPIIWGTLLGFAWALSGLRMPVFMDTTIAYLARLASPMGLLAMGAKLDFRELGKRVWPVFTASFMKLIGCAAVFIPAAVYFGFRTEKLIAVLVMLGSASTVTCFVMAKNMGHEGVVSAGTVALTTVLSSFTLTIWIWFLRSHGLV